MNVTPVFSTLGADPDLGELVEMFVCELPNRVSSLEEAFQGSDIERLRTLAHQLKGAAGSYGFGPISPVAEALEKATEESSEAEIAQCVEDLVGICQRARAGSPN
jgi:HPt (histidine-containing phosphotransfer) domain-containing protein